MSLTAEFLEKELNVDECFWTFGQGKALTAAENPAELRYRVKWIAKASVESVSKRESFNRFNCKTMIL